MAEPRERKRKPRSTPRVGTVILADDTENADEIEAKTEASVAGEEQIDAAIENTAPVPEARIYRVNEMSGQEAYLDKVTPELISTEWLAKEYGGGRYRVQFRKPDPSGKNRLVYDKQARFEVDANLPQKPPRYARVTASGPVQNADGSPAGARSGGMDDVMQSGILALFNQMQNANQMVLTFVQQMAERKPEAPKGPGILEMIAALTPLLTPFITSMVERKDPLDLATKLLALRGNAEPTATPNDPIEMFRKFLELREMMGEGAAGVDDPNAPMYKLIETIAPQFLQVFQRAQEIDAQAKLTAGRGPTQTPTPARATATPAAVTTGSGPVSEPRAPVPAQPSAGAETEMWKVLVGQRIPVIMKLAQRGKRADLYAELEADNIPEIFKDAVKAFVEREDFVELIFAEYPQLHEHEEWMRDFFDVFAAAITGELDADDDGDDDEFEEVEIAPNGEVKPVADADTPPVQNNGSVE